MGRRIWEFLRWPLAVALLGWVVYWTAPRAVEALGNSFEFGTTGGLTETEAATATPTPTETPVQIPTGPVDDGTAAPLTDFAVDGGVIAGLAAEEIVISEEPGDAVVLAFDAIGGDPGCLATVLLEIAVIDATTTEVGAWPASAVDPGTVADGVAVPDPLLLNPQPGARALTDGSPGRLQWDITAAYQEWVTSGQAPADGPFTLAVTATSPVEPGGGVQFASSDAGEDDAPSLTWTGVEGCGAPATPTSTPTPTSTQTA